MNAQADESDFETGPSPGGELSMAISREMVALMKDYFGRGPAKARTYIRDNLIVVIMEDTMTKAEITLVDSGNIREVRDLRRLFQETLRDGAVELVERLSGRTVAAFMSDHDTEKDVAAEIFVMATGSEGVPGTSGEVLAADTA